jgi:hypothetical protein
MIQTVFKPECVTRRGFRRQPGFDRRFLDHNLSDEDETEAFIGSVARYLATPYCCWYPLRPGAGPGSANRGAGIEGPGHIVTTHITCLASGRTVEIATSLEALCQANLPEACSDHKIPVRSGPSFIEHSLDLCLFEIHWGAVPGVPLCAACIRVLKAHDTTGWRGYEP